MEAPMSATKQVLAHAAIKHRLFNRLFAAALIGLAFSVAAPAAVLAADPVYTSTWNNRAVSGYDPVAYFTQGKPVKGDSTHSFKYKGATWYFASKENLEKFKADPVKYAPQYGGYCAWAIAMGKTASADPKYWKIVDGKLYLNYDQDIQKKWEKDVPGFIQKANSAWPQVVAK
jgi:YHS domain-containing protein